MTYPPPPPPERPPAPAKPSPAEIFSQAWVSYSLIGITVIMYLLQLLTDQYQGSSVTDLGAKINQAIYAGQLWRFVTPIFLHGSEIHIAFNMYALFVMGPDLEQTYGHRRFFLLYFLAGIAGNVASFYFSPAPSLGASTALFGLIAAQGIFVYQNRQLFGSRARSVLTKILTIAALNLVLGLSPGIDNWGHLGGLVGGLAFAWFAGPKLHQEIIRMPGINSSLSDAYPAEMQPQFMMRLVDQVSSQLIWLTALAEFIVLAFLILVRIYF